MSTFSTYRKSGATAAYPVVTFPDNFSLLFDGDATATFDINAFDLGTNDFSIAYWMKYGGFQPTGTIFTAGRGSSISLTYFGLVSSLNSGKPVLSVQFGSWSAISYITVDTDLSDNSWHHILFTIDRDADSSVYVDGALNNTQGFFHQSEEDFDMTLGAGILGNSSLGTLPYDGLLNDFALWDVKLTSGDATSIYNSGSPNDLTNANSYDTDRTSNLKLYWKMEEGSGTTSADSSGHGYSISSIDTWSSDTP